MNKELEKKVKELESIVKSARKHGMVGLANTYEEKVKELLANEELVGNKPRRG